MAAVAECFSLRPPQEEFLFPPGVFITAMVGVAGDTGNCAFWIERHIRGYVHGRDYVHRMRKAPGGFVVIIMAAGAYFIGFPGESDIAVIEREPEMTIMAKDLSSFIVDGICVVKRNEGE